MSTTRILAKNFRLWHSSVTTLARVGTFYGADLLTTKRNVHSGYNGNGTRTFENITVSILGLSGIAAGYQVFVYLDNKTRKKDAAIEVVDIPVNTADETVEVAKIAEELPILPTHHKMIRADLPMYTMEEVKKHNTIESKVWITYGVGVYDITNYIESHPVSKYAAGSALEPFWIKHPEHSKQYVYDLLETFRIGNLTSADDVVQSKQSAKTSENNNSLNSMPTDPSQWHKTVRKDLPTFRMEDVQKHDSLEKGVWVTYGIGVYDITDFIPKHPGSEKIMLGAGSAIDPFWHVYQQHNTEQVLKLLESYRIANLNAEDEIGTKDLHDPWVNEPKRHPLLKPASKRPFNAEPPANILVDSFLTPVDFFYVRNHLPVPYIDVNTYELEISIDGQEKEINLKMDDIKNMPKVTLTAAVMCGGNRRSEMNKVKEVKGLSWGPAAVGNAEWTGVRLRDVLKLLEVESDEVRHVIFEGYDTDPTSSPYAASIPLSKAMDERGDVLLAYEMNGKPLTRDHGYPLRVIVPGVVGARNVKWIGRITVSEKESDSLWQQKDYKGFSPSTDWDTVDFSKSPAIQSMPVTSAICEPLPGEKVKIDKDDYVTVRGYAWSGGGNRIVRVDLTGDNGKTWQTAELQQEDITKAPSGRHWGWTLWTARIPVDKDAEEIEIWSKAVDSNYNSQPEEFKNIWNLRGVLSNAYSKTKIKLVHE